MVKKFNASIHEEVSIRHPNSAYIVIPITGLDLSCYSGSLSRITNQLIDIGISSENEVHAEEQIEHWKSIYRGMRLSRSKGRSSFESNYRRAKKAGKLPSINPFVDLYNSISLHTRTCIGAYDAAKLYGDIQLSTVPLEQEMVPIGQKEGMLVERESIAYFDDEGIICCYWNCRDAQRTCINASTRDVIVCIDVGTDLNSAWNASKLLSAETPQLGGIVGEATLVDKNHSHCSITLT